MLTSIKRWLTACGGGKKEFEFLTFKGNKENVELKGKSYGEGEIIEFALSNSELLKNEEYFFKVSGRYFLENNIKILKKLDLNKNYFAPWNYKLRKQEGIDTVFFGCKVSDYKEYFLRLYEYADDSNGNAFEHIIFNKLKEGKIAYFYFPLSPRYDVPMQASTGIVPVYKWYKELYKSVWLSAVNKLINLKYK